MGRKMEEISDSLTLSTLPSMLVRVAYFLSFLLGMPTFIYILQAQRKLGFGGLSLPYWRALGLNNVPVIGWLYPPAQGEPLVRFVLRGMYEIELLIYTVLFALTILGFFVASGKKMMEHVG